MSSRIFLIALAVLFAASAALTTKHARSASAPTNIQQKRVRDAFTSWDNEYFYAGFHVNDINVVSKNDSPISRPQEDDDIEVFIDTSGPGKSNVRTATTFQMAVSAASGAYFSVGNGTAIPHPKTVLTYKFASNIEGTLNTTGDRDTGYTIEMAIPWSVLGMANPPQPGTQFGFNVVSRDRSSTTSVADTAFSLSPKVMTRADIQNPSKWTVIEIAGAVTAGRSTSAHVYCPRVSDSRYTPVIDGVLRGGEWPIAAGFTFGDAGFSSPAPTEAEEPNIKVLSLEPEPEPVTPPATPTTPKPPVTPTPTPVTPDTTTPATTGPNYNIYLPGGTTVHVGTAPPVVPHPFVILPDLPPPPKVPKHPKTVVVSRPDLPLVTGEHKPFGMPDVDFSGAAPLPAQTRVQQLVFADYFLSTKPNSALIGLDQPADPSIQLSDIPAVADLIHNAADSGINVLLVHYGGRGDTEALLRLVAALKLLKHQHHDYPLLALSNEGIADDVISFFSAIPPIFRAQVTLPDSVDNSRGYIAIVDDKNLTEDLEKAFRSAFGERAGLFLTSMGGSEMCKIATVSPGGKGVAGSLAGRAKASTYLDSWKAAMDSGADWVIVSSLNDYVNGTEIATSRQYGDQYLDLTRVKSLAFHGAHPWSVTFEQNDCPAIINPGALTAVTVRVENTGTIAWRAAENYALSYRWYRDGALYDDSAPRISFPNDILPGETVTLGVGIAPINSYGTKMEPGDYTLVFDVVQGNARWFSFTGNVPLKVSVHIPDTTDTIPDRYWLVDSSTPAVFTPGMTAPVTVSVRNDTGSIWKAGKTTLDYDIIQTGSSDTGAASHGTVTLNADANPGMVATFPAQIKIGTTTADNDPVQIKWYLNAPDRRPLYTETVPVGPSLTASSFTLSDIPRHLKTGEKTTGQVAFVTGDSGAWPKNSITVTSHWSTLDGRPLDLPTASVANSSSIDAGGNYVFRAPYIAPKYAGRYVVTFTATPSPAPTPAAGQKHPEVSSLPVLGNLFTAHAPLATLSVQVWVTPDGDAATIPLDLTALFNARGIAFEGDTTTDGFDGKGGAIPGEQIPPDGTHETFGNPFVIGKPGPAYYPNGFYTLSSSLSSAQDESLTPRTSPMISFVYPDKTGKDMIACSGQTISIPDGAYKSIHLVAAAASTDAVTADFTIENGQTDKAVDHVAIQSWSKPSTDGTVAFQAPYHLNNGAIDTSAPSVLSHYVLRADGIKHVSRIVLPNDPRIKIFAITLER